MTDHITIRHKEGNTVTGTPEQVLNHGHLKDGWEYVPETLPLDPQPYRQMLGYSRWASREDAPDTHAYVFDPRYGYSQNPEDYS